MRDRLTLTVTEAAELLGVSRGTAYEAARSGDLPTVKIGTRLLVPRARLLALLGEQIEPFRFGTPPLPTELR